MALKDIAVVCVGVLWLAALLLKIYVEHREDKKDY